MQPVELAERLSAHQGSDGAFRSYVVFTNRREEDQNGFVTALVLRALRRFGQTPEFEALRQRALDFLETCASPQIQGAFSFYPRLQRPSWSKRIPADVDDTAIINLELFFHARRTLSDLRSVIFDVLMPALLQDIDPYGPPWISPLVFPTWLAPAQSRRANPVDCCVNANVVALLAIAQLTDLPGYAEACRLIADGLAWAGNSWLRLTSLTPYYPQPVEFLHAVEHAVACGAHELRAAQPQLDQFCTASTPPLRLRDAVCSNAYGGPVWHCPALKIARNVYIPGRHPIHVPVSVG